MNWLLLFCMVFACYRLARLVSVDFGPYDVFLKMRAFFGRLAAIQFKTRFIHLTFKTIADLLNCQFCSGMWIALVLALMFDLGIPRWLAWFAIAGGQAKLAEWSKQDDE